MIEMAAHWKGIKFICSIVSRFDRAGPNSRHAIHGRRVDAVKVDCMRVGAGVDKLDPDVVSLHTTNGGAGNSSDHLPRSLAFGRCRATVHPAGEENPRGYFNLLVGCDEFIFAQGTPVLQLAGRTVIEFREHVFWMESVFFMINFTHNSKPAVAGLWIGDGLA